MRLERSIEMLALIFRSFGILVVALITVSLRQRRQRIDEEIDEPIKFEAPRLAMIFLVFGLEIVVCFLY